MSSNGKKVIAVRDGGVLTVTLNDPERRNALTNETLADLAALVAEADRTPDLRCVLIAGLDRFFAAGADVRSLSQSSASEAYMGERGRSWATLRQVGLPMVAAVSGYCLGGGFELALIADVIIASESAVFGLPETGLGLIPGAGGAQLLARAVGRAVAMDVVLSGRRLSAAEAAQAGLVSRIAPQDEYLDLALDVARAIAERPRTAQRLAREAVASAYELPLEAGIMADRRAFALAIANEDAREGMTAFLEKRKPNWSHE